MITPHPPLHLTVQRRHLLLLILCGLLSWTSPTLQAQAAEAESKDKKSKDAVEDKVSTTHHTVRIGGKDFGYRATAGTLVLKDEEGKPKASFFYVAYTTTNTSNPSDRPLTFSFNGGPGSCSVWLHLGVLGPKRVVLNDDGSLPPPPFKLSDNEYSLIDRTDLVFIDPISTGYSRPAPGEDAKKYHGVDEDVQSVAEFIRLYVTRHQRWLSPKYLIGESYGTTRAAALSGHLGDRHGLYLNGIMLVSVVLDFQTISFNVGNDLPHVLFLPSLTATAWYHKKLAPELQADLKRTLSEAETFALGDYATALLKGNTLSAEERLKVAQSLARLTGLQVDYVQRAHLRVNVHQFFKELLRTDGKTVGRFDSRLVGEDRNGVGDGADYDPSYTAVQGPFTAAINDYIRRELQFESDLPYEILTGKVQPWNYGDARNRYLNVAETLRGAMTENPYLKLFVANGIYDLATPYLATRYTLQHMTMQPSVAARITMADYPAGHMMYTHKPSLEQLKQDLSRFLQ